MSAADPMALVDALRASGAIDALDHRFAALVARRAGVVDERLLAAAALASRAPSRGDVCLDLERATELVTLDSARHADAEGDAERVAVPTLPDPAEWAEVLATAPELFARPGADDPAQRAPLVVDGGGVYLDRFWRYENRLVRAVQAKANLLRTDVNLGRLRADLDAVFPNNDPREALQRLAVATGVLRGFSVISGGPGTGKTAVVARLLALVASQREASGQPSPRIVLVAPTGKAAARLTESIRAQLSGLAPGHQEALRTPTVTLEASTIHRALGARPGTTRVRHHEGNPLPADLVVVDEASMVDLPMMAKVLAAVPARARLVLLGDPDQLVSVELGSVLGDICRAGGGRISQPMSQMLRAVGVPVDDAAVGASIAPILPDGLVRLLHEWRYAPGSSIPDLAHAINEDRPDDVMAVFDDPARSDAVRLQPGADTGAALDAILRPRVVSRYLSVTATDDPRQALERLGAFRVLCAHRRGVWGADRVGGAIEDWLAAEGALALTSPWYAHRPVMIRSNDARIRLFNGDVGILLPPPGDPTAPCRAWFATADEPRHFAPGALPQHQTVFATTVHKSQGSEYGEVLVVLPPHASPLLTRELLYTAVTRARERVTVVGSEAVVRGAVGLRTQRVSQLRAKLTAGY